MAHKTERKNAVQLDQKRSDIFPPLGVPLWALALQNAGFGRAEKSQSTFKKIKWNVKMHNKMPFD